jgi:hypothetical protein
MNNENSTKTRIEQNGCYKLPFILIEKYGFILKNNYDGLLEYHHSLGKNNYIELTNFENIYSLTYHLNGTKIVIANRYECNTEAELDFILLKGRWGDYFQSTK